MKVAQNIDLLMKRTQGRVIVAATKYVGSEQMRVLFESGIHDFGENRVQDMLRKQEELSDLSIQWHFIGSLQTNKVKSVINRIHFLHSLDRLSLAEAIQKYRVEPLPCFVEVNVSQEASKSGIKPEELIDFCRNLEKYDKIVVVGLMTMAPYTDDLNLIRACFSSLRDLRDALKRASLPGAPAPWLSMGMSNDYEVAIEYGATHLRLGSILFDKGDE